MSNRISHATIPATVDFHSELGTHRNTIVPFLAPGMENLAKRLEYVIEKQPIETRQMHISDLSLPLANDSLSFLTPILGIHASAIPKFFVYVADLKTGQFSLRAKAANSSSASNKHRITGTPQSLTASTNTSFIILGKIGYEPQGLIRLIN
uniref:Uncharacterized protein n=1 Tax=Glossina austeni TaxID=7395 RepID=A0A1A9UY81_GLOAU